MRRFPVAFIGRNQMTGIEVRRALYGGVEKAYKVTQPVDTRKQWREVQKSKRKPS